MILQKQDIVHTIHGLFATDINLSAWLILEKLIGLH